VKLLVSVRSVDEALLAAQGGVDFIDLKEPRDGALGGLPIETIGKIVEALRRHGHALPISATIGDLGLHEHERILARVAAVGHCGVTYVKVGIARAPEAPRVLAALAASGWAIVPVFIADGGLDFEHVAQAGALGFPGVMVDTADKLAGSLFDAIERADLRRFVAMVRANGAMVGLAGALRLTHLPALRELAPDFAGFRSAVCIQDRGSALDAERLRALVRAVRGGSTGSAPAGPTLSV
jgi:(5-formylfuran-3-yl)methyl phosphate synthase